MGCDANHRRCTTHCKSETEKIGDIAITLVFVSTGH